MFHTSTTNFILIIAWLVCFLFMDEEGLFAPWLPALGMDVLMVVVMVIQREISYILIGISKGVYKALLSVNG